MGFDDTITVFQGEKIDIPLLFEDSGGVPHDLAGDKVEFVLVRSFNDTTKILEFDSDTAAEIEIDAPTTLGTATLKFLTSTFSTQEAASYQWMIFLDQGSGVRNPWGGGCFDVKASVDP